MTATTPLPRQHYSRLDLSPLETFRQPENPIGPLAISILPWLDQGLVVNHLPATQEARSALGHSSLVEGVSPHQRLVLARALAATFVELVDELLASLEEPAPRRELRADQSRQSDGLISPREREVLALVVAGRSNKEIAEALFISPFTVKAHVASLLTKLDADNRAQLAGIAMRRGLLAA